MKAIVQVKLKTGVLDPQGKAVADALERLGFNEVKDVRIGKTIEIELDDSLDKSLAEDQLKDMCESLLANVVIEQYEISISP